MDSLLQEYQGIKFSVEYVQSIQKYAWFRIHVLDGEPYNVTIESEDIKQAKQQVIREFQEFLDKQHI